MISRGQITYFLRGGLVCCQGKGKEGRKERGEFKPLDSVKGIWGDPVGGAEVTSLVMWCIIAFVALMLFLFILRGGAECCAELRGKGGEVKGVDEGV